MNRWIVAITGASGMRYAISLLKALMDAQVKVDLVISEAGARVLKEEEDISFSVRKRDASVLFVGEAEERLNKLTNQLRVYHPEDVGCEIASGSALISGMVVIPCSMSSLAAIAAGFGQNLIQRAADVTLKEGRKLILAPRETPLSSIQLENMLRLSRSGATIVPAMPGVYNKPKSIDDVVDMFVMKILDQMGIYRDSKARWKPSESYAEVSALTVVGKNTSSE